VGYCRLRPAAARLHRDWINDLRCTRDEIDQFIETYARQSAGQANQDIP